MSRRVVDGLLLGAFTGRVLFVLVLLSTSAGESSTSNITDIPRRVWTRTDDESPSEERRLDGCYAMATPLWRRVPAPGRPA